NGAVILLGGFALRATHLLLPPGDNAPNFPIAYVYTLRTFKLSGEWVQVKHIPFTEQRFSPGRIQNYARIHQGSYGKGNSGREVGFNIPSDNVNTRPLRSDDQMHANRARFLRQTHQSPVSFLRRSQHQVREFVN